MKIYKFMKIFYEISFELRYRAKLSYWLVWARDIVIFLQYLFFSLNFCSIDQITEGNVTFLKAAHNTLILNSWIYYTATPVYFSILMVIANLSFISYFIYSAFQSKKGKYNPINKLYTFSLVFEFIQPLIQVQNFVRLNMQTMFTLSHFSGANLVSMFFLFFNVLISAAYEYYASVFLQPRLIMINSFLDVISGATSHTLFWCRFMSIHTQIILATRYHYMKEITVFTVYGSLAYYTLFKRIFKGVNYSIFGAVLHDSPLFAHPILMYCHIHDIFSDHMIILAIALVLFYTASYWLYMRAVKYYAPLVFNHRLETSFPMNAALMIRNVAKREADIEGIQDYMVTRMRDDPDELLEILRFLGIFRSLRSQLLMALSSKKCTNAYYHYQFYAFTRVFKSYSSPTPQNYIANLDRIHRSYLVNLSLYWNYRYNNNIWKMILHGINTAILHVELISFVNFLAYIYQYDYYVIQSLSEVALVAMGQPKLSAYYKHYCNKLREHNKPIIDPIFRSMAAYYPISLQKYLQETKRSSSEGIIETTYSFGSTPIRFHINENTIYRDESTERSVTAMFVQRNTKLSSGALFLNIVLALIWGYLFANFDQSSRSSSSNQLKNIDFELKKCYSLAENLTAALILPSILSDLNINFMKSKNCTKDYYNIYNGIIDHIMKIRSDYYYHIHMLSTISDYLTSLATNHEDYCKSLRIVTENYTTLSYEIFDKMLLSANYFHNNVTHAIKTINIIPTLNLYMLVLFPFIVFGSVIIFIVIYLHLKISLRKIPNSCVEFLGSKERLGLLLFKKSLESWDLFKILYPMANQEGEKLGIFELYNKTKQQFKRQKIMKFSSETDVGKSQKSHHIDLKDSKLALSFIGSSDYLYPQQFALMSPFVKTNSPVISGELSETSTSDSTETSTTTLENPVLQESLENLEIVTAATKIATFEKKFFFSNLVLLVLIPWFSLLTIVFYAKYIALYSVFFNSEKLEIIDEKFRRISLTINYLNTAMRTIPEPWKDNKNFKFNNGNVSYDMIPHLLNQYLTQNKEISEMITEISIVPPNGSIAFVIYCILFFILCCIAAYHVDIKSSVGFDSLFHFPTGFVDDLNKPKDLPPKEILTNSVIDVKVDLNTGFINYISQNSMQILNIDPINLIGRKYEEYFVKDAENSRVFTTNSRRQKKFLECRYSSGHLINIALYNISVEQASVESIQKSLSTYMPNNIAKNFCEKGITLYDMKDQFIIILKFDNEVFNSSIDYLFSVIHNNIQCYTTISMLRCEGSCIYFACDMTDPLIPLLFVRDMIENSKPPKNKPQIKCIVQSFVITNSDIRAKIHYVTEPYISINYGKVKKNVPKVFSCPDNHVIIIGNSIQIPENFDKSILQVDETDIIIPFSNFDKFVDCIC